MSTVQSFPKLAIGCQKKIPESVFRSHIQVLNCINDESCTDTSIKIKDQGNDFNLYVSIARFHLVKVYKQLKSHHRPGSCPKYQMALNPSKCIQIEMSYSGV